MSSGLDLLYPGVQPHCTRREKMLHRNVINEKLAELKKEINKTIENYKSEHLESLPRFEMK